MLLELVVYVNEVSQERTGQLDDYNIEMQVHGHLVLDILLLHEQLVEMDELHEVREVVHDELVLHLFNEQGIIDFIVLLKHLVL